MCWSGLCSCSLSNQQKQDSSYQKPQASLDVESPCFHQYDFLSPSHTLFSSQMASFRDSLFPPTEMQSSKLDSSDGSHMPILDPVPLAVDALIAKTDHLPHPSYLQGRWSQGRYSPLVHKAGFDLYCSIIYSCWLLCRLLLLFIYFLNKDIIDI